MAPLILWHAVQRLHPSAIGGSQGRVHRPPCSQRERRKRALLTLSTCAPHPAQVGFWQLLHVTRLHMVPGNASEDDLRNGDRAQAAGSDWRGVHRCLDAHRKCAVGCGQRRSPQAATGASRHVAPRVTPLSSNPASCTLRPRQLPSYTLTNLLRLHSMGA
jgi:hypothetical protein